MRQTLYIGTTNDPNLFHIGMTKRFPKERWKDPDYSKLPYIPEPIAFYDIGNNRDHDIHSLLREYGIKDLRKLGLSRSPEIFKVENEYIIATENSLYIVSASIQTKRIS